MNMNKTLTLPERFGQIIEAVGQRDRKYFEENPTATSYTRLYVPGEFYPYHPKGDWVRVHQIKPGVRLRELLEQPKGVA